jgi:beta-galactosidase
MDGLVYPDRTPHTGLIEYKNVLRPARVVDADIEKGRFTIWNTLDFTNLKDALRIVYTVRQNGQDIYTADIPADWLDIPPHARKEIALPMPAGLPGDFAVHFTEYTLHADGLVPAGHLVGEDEAGCQTYAAPAVPKHNASITLRETNRTIILEGASFHYVYNKTSAAFDELVHGNRTLITQPMHWNIWRAPTDNDRRIAPEWLNKRYHDSAARGYATAIVFEGNSIRLSTEFSICTPYLPPHIRGKAVWHIQPNGEIFLTCDAARREQLPFLPRFGLRLFLPREIDQVSYFGYGPYESYIDKRRSSFLGLYSARVADMHEDYIKPQENGSHYGCTLLQVADSETTLQVTGESFSFNASHYTQEELTEKKHNFELKKCNSTVLCVDGYQSGIGSGSCGPMLAPEYQIPIQMHFSCTFSVLHK